MNEDRKREIGHWVTGVLLVFTLVAVVLFAFFLRGKAIEDRAEEQRVEYEADLAQYCRGVIDEYIVYSRAPQPVPAETYVELETFCIEGIKTGDHAEGFRGPIDQ